jgi:hypothetical protein
MGKTKFESPKHVFDVETLIKKKAAKEHNFSDLNEPWEEENPEGYSVMKEFFTKMKVKKQLAEQKVKQIQNQINTHKKISILNSWKNKSASIDQYCVSSDSDGDLSFI